MFVIGNPYAGPYNVVGKRYNFTGNIGYTCGSPIPTNYISTATSPTPKLATAVNASQISIGFANLEGNGYHYIISVQGTNAIVSSDSLEITAPKCDIN